MFHAFNIRKIHKCQSARYELVNTYEKDKSNNAGIFDIRWNVIVQFDRFFVC